MKKELLEKYNIPVPRYTSYPPANFFKSGFEEDTYKKILIDSNNQNPKELSFYFHIPFCPKLCHYCGCNSLKCVDKGTMMQYISDLHTEIDMLGNYLDSNRRISQIHFGGGTPSMLSPLIIKELNDHLRSMFQTIDNPEIAIECHPGYLHHREWEQLVEAGFTRISLGVQDFDKEVLKTVNRNPSLIKEEEIVAFLHSKGIKVNMDFLYGLPLQNAQSFSETIRRAVEIGPDRLVTFSYAHLPQIFQRQAVLEKTGLPSSDEKSRMFECASNILDSAGYKAIGMDHFVRPDDELNLALQNGQLYRNFQGYCTRRTTGQVYAIGVTGITQLTSAYVQNTKDLKEYMEQIEAGKLPCSKGYLLNSKEQITRSVIEMCMCNYQIDWNILSNNLSLPIEQIKEAIDYSDKKMKEFADDGIIEYDDHHLKITSEGSLFVRNVAASFDCLLKNTNKSFSKPV